MAGFSENFIIQDEFEIVLATSCCQDYGANSSEPIEKITTDENAYQQSYLGVIPSIVIPVTNLPSINNSKKLAYLDTSYVANKTAEIAQKKSNNMSMISFIRSKSEIRIYRVSSGKRWDGKISYMTAYRNCFNICR